MNVLPPLILISAFLQAVPAPHAPPAGASTVYVVRHAERADANPAAAPTMAADPELSVEGRARAESLARTLRDAGITAIFATEYKRTQQTAEPLARLLGMSVTVVPAKNEAALIEQVKREAGSVLVVGHSNTVGSVVKALGVATEVTVGDAEYDHLLAVVRGDRPVMLHLHYR